jgi:soluble lytic murein transglycosylase-like protein
MKMSMVLIAIEISYDNHRRGLMQTKHILPIVAVVQALLISTGTFYLLAIHDERTWLREAYFQQLGIATLASEEIREISVIAARYEAEIKQLKREQLRLKIIDYVHSVNEEAPAIEIAEAVLMAQDETGIHAAWLLAKIKQESYFNPRAVSSTGCRGLAQLCKRASQEVGLSWGDAFNPMANIMAGARYLKTQFIVTGNMRAALVRYNGGDDPAFVERIERHRVRILLAIS